MNDIWIAVTAAIASIIVLYFVLAWRGDNGKLKYHCPECGMGSDDPQEVFHHITRVHNSSRRE